MLEPGLQLNLQAGRGFIIDFDAQGLKTWERPLQHLQAIPPETNKVSTSHLEEVGVE